MRQFSEKGSAARLERFLFQRRRILNVGPEVVETHQGLSLEAVAPVRRAEVEYPSEGQPAVVELNLEVGLMLQGIYESDLHPIRLALVELVVVFVAEVRSNFSYVPCLQLSTAAEIKLRQRLTEKKADYRD
ncbi:MAG TPA: hypothetical protein VJR49_03395 [Chthoniobacterales bacterium]|nr:hypothetical protein [Chthoniobacterales bacterium]